MSGIFSIQKLQNVFVTNNSVIIKKNKIVRGSCVRESNYTQYKKARFHLKYFFPFSSFSKKQHILISDEWSKNYCHWVWEALSKLSDLTKEFPDAILVLPKSYLKIDFMAKSIAAFGFNKNNIKTISKRSRLWIRNLAFIPCISIETPGYYDYLRFRDVAKKLVSHFKESLKTNYGSRIYISRSDPKKNTARKVSNEKELTDMLAKYGFKTVYMENYSFLEQISISHFAKIVVAPHGAGITNVMFSDQCHLFELINEKWAKTCFAEMCERIDSIYTRIDCKQSDDRTIHLGDINVDVKNLEEKLTKVLR